jgi:transcriptional regulator with XRE-family HTH domain
MATRMTHGPAIRALIDALGKRHGDVAIACDISPGYLANIEKGVKQPSPAVARRIADFLAVPLDAITYSLPDREGEAA